MIRKYLFLCALTLTSCNQQPAEKNITSETATVDAASIETTVTNRWYTQSQLETGNKIYQQHCLQCHNKNAAGILSWKKTLADGNYPPPPLNGTAHAWHHDMGTLSRTIKNGGIALGGVMPGFSNKLSTQEVSAVIAYFQSFWGDEIYNAWLENGGLIE